MPGVLVRVPLGEVVALAIPYGRRIERIAPFSLRIPAAHEPERRIKHVPPVPRAAEEEFRVLLAAELRGHLRCAPVVVGALERAGDGLAPDHVVRIVPVPVEKVPPLLDAPLVPLRQRLLDLRVDALPVALEPLQVRIDENRDGVRADHALVVAAPERPYRQIPRELALALHRADEIRNDLWNEDRVEGMRGAEGVPRGERGVVRLTAGVGNVVRLHEKVVEGRVEVALLVVASLDVHAREELRPLPVRGRCDAAEVPVRDLRREIALRVRDSAEGGERDLHDERLALRRAEVEYEIPFRGKRTAELHLEGVGALDPVVDDDLSRHASLPVRSDVAELDARARRPSPRYAPARVDEEAAARALRIR